MGGGGGGGVRGPVFTVVRGPRPWGGPWTGRQCFRVTRVLYVYLFHSVIATGSEYCMQLIV